LRAAVFVLERRDRSRWGQRDDPAGGASVQEIASAIRALQLDVQNSVPSAPPEEVAG